MGKIPIRKKNKEHYLEELEERIVSLINCIFICLGGVPHFLPLPSCLSSFKILEVLRLIWRKITIYKLVVKPFWLVRTILSYEGFECKVVARMSHILTWNS